MVRPDKTRPSAGMLALPIFPGRLQPSIVGRSELNFRVRDGNGWTLALINTNYCTPQKPSTIQLYGILHALPLFQGW